MQMDEVLCDIAEDVKNFAVIYCVGRCSFHFLAQSLQILQRYQTSTQCTNSMTHAR